MTRAQRLSFYLPPWHKACRANWTSCKGQAQKAPGRVESDTLDELIRAAKKLSGKAYPSLDDLRYACHALARRHLRAHACGVPETTMPLPPDKISSDDLTNAEIEQVVWLFRLLADPDDLDAVIHWTHPENDQRKRFTWALENRFQGGYVARVCQDKFGTSDFHSLTLECLTELMMTLQSRPGARKAVAPRAQEPTEETVSQPF